MNALRPPGLGPVIGHTTDKTCRLWIQAGDLEDRTGILDANRRTIGVLGVISEDGKKVTKAYYFRLQREFDRTGTFVLGADVALGRYKTDDIPLAEQDKPLQLTPDTSYRVRMATLTIDDPWPHNESLSDFDLAKFLPPIENIGPALLDASIDPYEITFRTFPASNKRQDTLSFLQGSCRYPGLLWKVKEADRIFEPMVAHLAEDPKTAPRFTVMVGDQIYADMLNRNVPIGRADTYTEFQDRYRAAFSSPNMRKLLSIAPNYMILDDHEIEDNWTQDRLKANHELFNFAIGAYMSYQWSHGPRTYDRRLFYNFGCGGYPFFVLDTRTQRFKDDEVGLRDNHLLGRPTIDPMHPSQLSLFLDWLTEQQRSAGNTPKFVVSSSVFCPNEMTERLDVAAGLAVDALGPTNARRREDSDSWPAYPLTRQAILDRIVQDKIQNVVFLTGDIHCSNIAKLDFTVGQKDTGLVAYDITSSAFYWPFPFANGDPNNYVHDSRDPKQRDPFPIAGGEMNYRAWAFTQEDNFCRVDIDKTSGTLRIRYFDRNGRLLTVSDQAGNRVDANVLPLAPWT
jgi:alkaline phosphatase D